MLLLDVVQVVRFLKRQDVWAAVCDLVPRGNSDPGDQSNLNALMEEIPGRPENCTCSDYFWSSHCACLDLMEDLNSRRSEGNRFL